MDLADPIFASRQMNTSSSKKLRAAGAAYSYAVSRLREISSDFKIREVPTRGFTWTVFIPNSGDAPEVGWKLHVAISTVHAEKHIAAVCTVLVAAEAAFKIPSTLDGLIRLNSGQAGITQIGKIVTVYPNSDNHLARISNALQQVEFDVGPLPPSDYVVDQAPGQSIRWGAFGNKQVRWTALGRPYFEIPGQQSGLVEDSREPPRHDDSRRRPLPSFFLPDLSIADEPLTIGVHTILPISRLSHGPRARVDLALRTPTIESCILKRAREKVAEDLDGNCSRVRLSNEAQMLAQVVNTRVAPTLFNYSEELNALVMSDESGTPINQLRGARGLRQLVAACQSLAQLHDHGVVHRDAKLANAIWKINGTVIWVDFELAAKIGEQHPIAAGTHGYIPSEGTSAIAHPSYDMFAIGASLAKWCLGIDPSRLPLRNTRHCVRRLLLASGQVTAERLFATLTNQTPGRRPSAAEAALHINSAKQTLLDEKNKRQVSLPVASLRRWARKVAATTIPALSTFQAPVAGSWRNNHIFSDICCTGINIGSSGILLGMMHLAKSGLESPSVDQWIRETAESLYNSEFEQTARGFFTGYSGAGVALAVAGLRLDAPRYVNRAVQMLCAAARVDDGEVDLFSGDAGVLYGGVHIARITRDERLYESLRPLADRVRARAIQRDGMPCWTATPEYDPECKIFLGAAHGAAGVALGLATWAGLARSEGDKARDLAHHVFQSIFRVARARKLPNTPETLDGSYRPAQYWCHGVAGYQWCLLQSFPSDSELFPAVRWANRALTAPSYEVDLPSMCHGLAGMLEVATMTRAWAMRHGSQRDVERCSERCNMIAFNLRCIEQPFFGTKVWSAEDPSEVTPDLWVGFLGPAVALTRFSEGLGDSMLSGTALMRLGINNR